MILNIIIFAVIVLIFFTLLYKLIPYRRAGDRKPLIALLPKYKKTVHLKANKSELENKLSTYGFKKIRSVNKSTYYERGYLLGDFSVKITKIKLEVKEIYNDLAEITLAASWFAAFDTGDFWIFITELAKKLEDK